MAKYILIDLIYNAFKQQYSPFHIFQRSDLGEFLYEY